MKNKIDRKIALDIETTGFNDSGVLYKNHKIIEIGAVEIVNRRLTNNKFHVYLNPERDINLEAFKIHGISNKKLINKPIFSEIYLKLINYIKNSEIIAHNANFDISFINYEIKNLNSKYKGIDEFCKIIDTLDIARNLFPGKKNNLDALCKRYNINNINRKLHSAELDAFLVAKLYLRMTSTQKKFNFDNFIQENNLLKNDKNRVSLKILKASSIEEEYHIQYLSNMKKNSKCLWMK